jgi:hypothetical protein
MEIKMNWKRKYKNNRPLMNSIFTGLFYFLFCWSLEFGVATKLPFILVMPYLPGLTFPLTTCYYKTVTNSLTFIRKIVHLTLSVLIYLGSVWLLSGELRMGAFFVIAGFSGSFFFLIATKYLLRKEISDFHILGTSVLSGLAFLLPYINKSAMYLGLALFLWTFFNGLLLNSEYKKALCR